MLSTAEFDEVGHPFTRLEALRLPIPVAKSQPILVPYAGVYERLEVESTPLLPDGK